MISYKDRKKLTFSGETLPIVEWAKRLGLTEGVIRGRIKRGWSVEEAFNGREKPLPVEQTRIRATVHDVPARCWMTGIL